MRAKTITPMKHGTIVRLATSTGLAIAIPATTIMAPAIGEDVRPKAPDKKAKAPKCGMSMPKEAACGVTASLKANVAASPEPVIVPKNQGPIEPPQRAMSLASRNKAMKVSISAKTCGKHACGDDDTQDVTVALAQAVKERLGELLRVGAGDE